MTNYWIFKVKDEFGGLYARKGIEIFEHRTKEGFWGIRALNEKGKLEKNVNQLAKGDFVVFYLVKTTGNCFVGTAVLDSVFQTLDDVQAKRLVHLEFIDWNQGVSLGDVNRWTKPLPVEYLAENSAFRGGNIYFQGSIKRIDRTVYNSIILKHEIIC